MRVGFDGGSRSQDIETQYYVRLYNASDAVYDQDTSDFEVAGSAVDPDIVADEVDTGVWRATLPSVPDGTYYYVVLDKDLNIVENSYTTIVVYDDEILVDELKQRVLLWEHFSGYNALQIVMPDGTPVAGAFLAVVLKSDFDAGDLSNIVGATVTTSRGWWQSPIMVNSPGDYMLIVKALGVIEDISLNIVIP